MALQLFRSRIGFPERRSRRVRLLGVDTVQFAPRPPSDGRSRADGFVVGYCGRFDAEKGVLDLVQAVRSARGRLARPVKLRLMGRSAYRDPLDQELSALSRQADWLELLPPVPNAQVPQFLRGLDVFVLAARILEDHQEHDAHALLEAMACGVPSIGTRSGIIPEIIGDGTGILVEPQQPDELAAAILALLTDESLRSRLAAAGRSKAEAEFSLEATARRKSEALREIWNEHGK
jgi:glycosyltransferase involved in cell wall biosynthesis